MAAYLISYLLILGLMIASFLDKRNKNIYIIISGLIMVTLGAFRHMVGTDFSSYNDLFLLAGLGNNTTMEVGFDKLAQLVHYIGGTPQLVFALSSFITVLFIFKFILQNSRISELSLFLYFTLPPLYLASFNGVRQILAVAIFAYSIQFIINRSFYKYLFSILFASLFHVTAILMLPLYFITNKRLNIYHIILIVTLYVIMLHFIGEILVLISLSENYLQNTSNEGLSLQAFVLLVITAISILLRKKLTSVDSGKNNTVINLLFIGTVIAFTPLFIDLDVAYVTRMSSYFTISLVILIPEMIGLFKRNKSRILLMSLTVLISSLYYFYNIFIMGKSYSMTPYHFNFILF